MNTKKSKISFVTLFGFQSPDAMGSIFDDPTTRTIITLTRLAGDRK